MWVLVIRALGLGFWGWRVLDFAWVVRLLVGRLFVLQYKVCDASGGGLLVPFLGLGWLGFLVFKLRYFRFVGFVWVCGFWWVLFC